MRKLLLYSISGILFFGATTIGFALLFKNYSTNVVEESNVVITTNIDGLNGAGVVVGEEGAAAVDSNRSKGGVNTMEAPPANDQEITIPQQDSEAPIAAPVISSTTNNYEADTSTKPKSTKSIKVGIIEFAPQNIVYDDVHYAYLKSTYGCWLSSGGEIGNYYWIPDSNQSIHSSDCYDILETYSFLDIFNNPNKGISKNVQRTVYGEEDTVETLHSVYYIKDFYENEALKYGVTDLSIDIDVMGPYTLASDPPASGRWDVGEGICSASLKEFFINEAIDREIDENKYDVIAYVYLSDWQLSGRSYKGFTSCASGSKSFNSVPTWILPEEGDSIVTLAHELGHSFGASDYYTAPCPQNPALWSCVKNPEGIPEPNKIPKYPQTKGCLMSPTIVSGKPGSGNETSIANLNQTVICDAEAEEFGWK